LLGLGSNWEGPVGRMLGANDEEKELRIGAEFERCGGQLRSTPFVGRKSSSSIVLILIRRKKTPKIESKESSTVPGCANKVQIITHRQRVLKNYKSRVGKPHGN
jgi:hypothetical protein